jgi:hypothetical protein
MNFQLAVPTKIIGAITTDAWSGAAGSFDEIPHMIKVELVLIDQDYGNELTTVFYAVDDHRLYPTVIPEAIKRALERGLDTEGRGYVAVDYAVGTVSGGIYQFQQVYLNHDYAWAAASDLGQILRTMAENDFRDVVPDTIHGWVELTKAEKEIIFCDLRAIVDGEEKDEIPKELSPGDELELRLRLEPHMAGGFYKTYKLNVPIDFPVGKAVVQIYGGLKALPREVDVGKKLRTEMEDARDAFVDPIEPVVPINFDELMESLKPDFTSDELVIQLVSTQDEDPDEDRPHTEVVIPLGGIVLGAFFQEVEIKGGEE